MIIIELTGRRLPAHRRWAPIGFRAAERYTNLRSPVLTRETISNRDLLVAHVPGTTQSRRDVRTLGAYNGGYADLRSPVLTPKTISNRDWKLLETSVTQTKQSPPPTSNRDKIAPSSSRDFRRAGILPAFFTLPVQMPFETRDKKRGSSLIDDWHEFWNCFPTRILTKIPSGPLQEFARFEEEQ
jgi:hypothetical protein